KKLIWAGKLSMDINQDRINTQGVKYKHFLPAKWARETGLFFNAKTGVVTKQPSVNYRHPSNVPDATEKKVLSAFVKAGNTAEATGEYTKMGKQAVYRYFEPVKLMTPCLACHGKPKGELDMLGYEKDGMDAGDVVGMISVAIAVKQ
ncbi:Tll0287-like domain-containing protein, partial [Candidatus Venteria ishoeyi]